ncbi:MAG: serine/threonine-protein kinase, partial [Actinomycetota bacterium]
MDLGGLEIEHLDDVVPMGPQAATDRFELYAATDRKLDRRVAVRVLPPITSSDDGIRFIDRARALAAVSSHPHIVTVFDAGLTDDHRPYLITELVDGPDLATRIADNGPLPWSEAVELVLQLADGLDQVHQGGERHRDLRPENVVLSGSTAKLTDIGLVPGPAPAPTPDTLAHRAPEALHGEGDERSDSYSLTSLLYFLIDGRGPFWRPSDALDAFLDRVASQSAPPLDPELVPTALAVFVTAGLSADPLDRPQHLGEFTAELRLILEGRTTGSTPSVLHQATGAVPAVPSRAALASTPAGAAAPAVSAASAAFAPPTPGDGHEVPSWTFDTAEINATEGRPLEPAVAWAPPSQAGTTAGTTTLSTTTAPELAGQPALVDATTVASFAPPANSAAAATSTVASVFDRPENPTARPEPAPVPTPSMPTSTSMPANDQTTLIPTFEADAPP